MAGTLVDIVIARTVLTNATHRSKRFIVSKTTTSQTAVSTIRRVVKLQLQGQEAFKRTFDSLFVDKAHEIARLYP